MKTTIQQLNQLINEVLNELEQREKDRPFNPFKQTSGGYMGSTKTLNKGPETAALDAMARAAIPRKPASKPASKPETEPLEIDYEKRGKNIILRRNITQKKLDDVYNQLLKLQNRAMQIKNTNTRINFYKTNETKIIDLMKQRDFLQKEIEDYNKNLYDTLNTLYNKFTKTSLPN